MRIVAATTFNLEGYHLYGRRMIDTFHRHWCCDVVLNVYVESWIPTQNFEEIRYRDLLTSSNWLDPFRRRNKGRNKSNSYRHDAVRFSHKVAALLATAEDETIDYLIWLDGDIITHSDFSRADLAPLLPDTDRIIAWLDRHEPWYPEMGFYILNCKHPHYQDFLKNYRAMYEQDYIFRLEEWHDCYAAEYIIKKMNLKTESLSGAGFHTDHPLVHGPLGQWFDHAKGMRKQRHGRTPKGEVRREEPYWRT